MNRSARVTSIEAIRAFGAELKEFELALQQSLESLTIEVRRAVEYFETDRGVHWPAEVRKASDRVAQAIIDLERCQVSIRPEDRPSCYLEKKALEQARARLHTAEAKVRLTQKWMRTVRREAEELKTRTAQITFLADHEMPRAHAFLERTSRHLDRYTGQQTTASNSASPMGETSGVSDSEPERG